MATVLEQFIQQHKGDFQGSPAVARVGVMYFTWTCLLNGNAEL